MEALRATYGADSEGSDADDSPAAESMSSRNGAKINSFEVRQQLHPLPVSLPPPPLDLLQTPDFPDFSSTTQGSRIRSFPHVEGNYALHVYIPVLIPTPIRTQLSIFIKQIASLVPGLFAVDCDFPIAELCKDNAKLEQILLGREFHISLGRTVPIQAHQIESIVAMLRQRFQSQRRYFIDFNKWDVFVNDEQTRSFLALEVIGAGLSENPRPHISLLWGLGETSGMLNQAVEKIERSSKNSSLPCRHIFTCKINGIECRIASMSAFIFVRAGVA
ncbi:U6 snRNA phosphodiesterase-like isoform X3 [Zingiber officinale]|uniref:U6 snRNA phosphodiesterase-like isoform X3 n=1 Tax=Zingiber officinale TaxID=94328 RepID=UPI001C4AD733|nr:U6 snRNA phosphodiesterase-like isoform X3 [Zingiber officinale]